MRGILFAITLVAGLLLGVVLIRLQRSQSHSQEAKGARRMRAVSVFADADKSFEAVTDFTEEAAQTVLNEGRLQRQPDVNALSWRQRMRQEQYLVM